MEYSNEIVEPKEELEPENYAYGEVIGCTSLKVRSTPDASNNDNVVKTIEVGTEVLIDFDKSTDEFYNVCTESGVDGYCMKKFIGTDM